MNNDDDGDQRRRATQSDESAEHRAGEWLDNAINQQRPTTSEDNDDDKQQKQKEGRGRKEEEEEEEGFKDLHRSIAAFIQYSIDQSVMVTHHACIQPQTQTYQFVLNSF